MTNPILVALRRTTYMALARAKMLGEPADKIRTLETKLASYDRLLRARHIEIINPELNENGCLTQKIR